MKHKLEPFHKLVTVQGLSRVCDDNSSKVRRAVWLVFLCGGIAFTVFNIQKQVLLFMSKPITVRVDHLLSTGPLIYPSITICNSNYLRKSQVQKHKNGTLFNMIPFFYPYRDFVELGARANLSQEDLEAATYFLDLDPLEAAFFVGHTMEDTFIRCEWESQPCVIGEIQHKFTDMGLCYSFNLDGSKFARNSGRAHGLRLVLNVQEEEYVRSGSGYLGVGFMVAVHAPEVPPIMSEMGIAVPPGFQHFMGVGVKTQTAKDGLSGCGSRPLEHIVANYSREACRLECRANFISEICHCRDYNVPIKVDYCSPEEYQSCYLPTLEKYLQEGTGCESNCPEPCSYTSFSTSHSSSPLSRDYITEYTKAMGGTEESWRSNLVILEIYLSSMAYEHMEKQRGYETIDLFCDIGGALGLLLGASVLSVLEVLDFICVRSLTCRQSKVRQIEVQPVKGNNISNSDVKITTVDVQMGN